MKTKILRVLCLLLVISMVAFPVNAAESNEPEFQLQGAEVTLYGEDVTVAKVSYRLTQLTKAGKAEKQQITVEGKENQKPRKIMGYKLA